MATQEFSFDIVSKVDLNEVKNAVNQAQKELENRYDFRGSAAKIDYDEEKIGLVADDEFKLDQLKEIVFSKLLKRGVDARSIEYGKIEPAAGVTVKQDVTFKQGIPQDQAKALSKQIKDKGLKVNAQIQGDQLRVTGKSKDDLQKAIQFVKGLDLPFPVDFINYR
ncbi:MAG: YajQ family cyclic di-GMP-binding protein [Fimbriimonadaceae bacterium]|nr:YajQ family cyclic di-GMP-binding protein [Fimbriimonadaceae bacterium]QYK55445.1 MAG: YajQ family cyclic di-GMP-binding protein [Fimbriimonadaceae bacterium]